jgi:PAS domain S-box-containing protein
MIKRFSASVAKFVNVPSQDPDDARRRKLLNMFMVPVFFVAIVAIIADLTLWRLQKPIEDATLLVGSLAMIVGLVIIYFINRSRPGQGAAIVFLVFLTLVFAFSDTPAQLAAGRSLFIFVIPIVLAAGLLKPWATFIFAGLATAVVVGLGISANVSPNIFAIIGYFVIAAVIWLIAQNLEHAVSDVRQINTHLDQIVQQRTQALTEALDRERIESGRRRAILESIADGVIVFDTNGNPILANSSLTKLLEMEYSELVGITQENITQSRFLDVSGQRLLEGMLAHPNVKQPNFKIRWDKKTLSVTSAQVIDQEKPLGLVAVFRDFSREAEVDRMKDTFLAIVSHELRTPLNAILGYAEMIKESIYGPVNEKQSRASERIMSNVKRLLEIVSDLLDQSQIEAGKLSLHVAPFRPTDLLENAHITMEKIAADKGLAFNVELDQALPRFINGDIARLQQILVNLANNSIKFTEKGSVGINLSLVDAKHWKMEVKDTGIGIPQEEIGHIFEAFRQVDSTVTRKYGGFGLGLSIVKQLAELMGGTVSVKSKIGEESGSTFIVILPLEEAKRIEKL